MPRQARGESIDPSQVQILHCVERCVRQAWLCGRDAATGRCYEHRRGWIRDRLEFLATIFGIDCLTFSIMSSHAHLVLRSRPDVVAAWSDDEVARRWLRLFPKRRNPDGSPAEPTRPELDLIRNQPKVLAERRRRLSDVSWYMRCLAENIADPGANRCGHAWLVRRRDQVRAHVQTRRWQPRASGRGGESAWPELALRPREPAGPVLGVTALSRLSQFRCL